jgi:hypothetical protein
MLAKLNAFYLRSDSMFQEFEVKRLRETVLSAVAVAELLGVHMAFSPCFISLHVLLVKE